ncbi:MAG: hypothetical protein ACRD3P_06345 [Terriglobales bacterium]
MKEATETTRCKAQTKAGKACRAAATAGGLCFFHGNPNKASELGRIGGRKNRHTAQNVEPLPTLDTAVAVRDAVNRLIRDVYSATLDPRVAAGLAPLLNLQLRAIGIAELERRIGELERQLTEVMSRQSENGAGESDNNSKKRARYAASGVA